VAVRAKASVSSQLTARIAGSNTAEGLNVRPMCLLCAVWEAASVKGRSLVQRSSTGCATLIVCKSDVWLTVHRISVWIRKTN